MPREWRPTPKQQRFIELILTGTMDQGRCYREAYQSKASDKVCQEEGSKLMSHPKVGPLITKGRQEVVQSIVLGHSDLARHWSEAITTDRNEISQVRRICCRYCYGVNHRYQETPAQREARWGQHQQMLAATPQKDWPKVPQFDELGGVGYDPRRKPVDDCPECFGDGEEKVYLADTRRLSPAAKALFEGIDIKNGAPVVKTRSRDTAEDRLAKHLGMFVDRSMVLTAHLQPKTLAEFYAQLPGQGPTPDDTDS